MKYVRKLILLVVFVACLTGQGANAEVAWTAYNDSYGGGSTAANVTDWTIHNYDQSHNFGKLKDFATGSDVGMPHVCFTMGIQGLRVSTSAGGNPAAGTDAYEIFNNIVDLSGYLVYYGGAGWWVEIEFTGLNPTRVYSFVGTSIRYSTDWAIRMGTWRINGRRLADRQASRLSPMPLWRTPRHIFL